MHHRARQLRGLESNGMLCSARELGLGEEGEGIMELAQSLKLNEEPAHGADLDDVTLEVNATRIAANCMSVFGIARDLCGGSGAPLSHPRDRLGGAARRGAAAVS